jgi:predicted RNase H-like HicB family nuclease
MQKVTISKRAEKYLGEPYARLLIPNERGGYTAEILEFPGCISEGRTADEAVQNLNDAAKSWVEASLEDGREIPSPASNYDHSGKVALRMPRSLHRQAAQMAERNSSSLNQYLVAAVAEQVGAGELYTRLIEKVEEFVQKSFASAVMHQNMYYSNTMNMQMNMTVNVASTVGSGSHGIFVNPAGAISNQPFPEPKVT